jgi:hypothetical protein
LTGCGRLRSGVKLGPAGRNYYLVLVGSSSTACTKLIVRSTSRSKSSHHRHSTFSRNFHHLCPTDQIKSTQCKSWPLDQPEPTLKEPQGLVTPSQNGSSASPRKRRRILSSPPTSRTPRAFSNAQMVGNTHNTTGRACYKQLQTWQDG